MTVNKGHLVGCGKSITSCYCRRNLQVDVMELFRFNSLSRCSFKLNVLSNLPLSDVSNIIISISNK
jgi:hypothetical protein